MIVETLWPLVGAIEAYMAQVPPPVVVPVYPVMPSAPASPFVLVALDGISYRSGLWSVRWRCHIVPADTAAPEERGAEMLQLVDLVVAACVQVGVPADTTAAAATFAQGDIRWPSWDVTTTVPATSCDLPQPVPANGGTARA